MTPTRGRVWPFPLSPQQQAKAHDCALDRGSVMCRVCDLDLVQKHEHQKQQREAIVNGEKAKW